MEAVALPSLYIFTISTRDDSISWPTDASFTARDLFSLPVRCPSNRPQFIGTPETSANNMTLVWDGPYSMHPLVFDPRYAVYTKCGRDAAPMLQYYNGNYNWTLQAADL